MSAIDEAFAGKDGSINWANPLVLYSGLGINEFGNPEKCNKEEGFHYIYLMAMVLKQGLCLPLECTTTELKSAVEKLVDDYLPGDNTMLKSMIGFGTEQEASA